MYYHSQALPWSVPGEDDKRFRKILNTTLGIFLITAIAMPFLPNIKKQIETPRDLPPPVARLLYEKPPEPVKVIEVPDPIIEPVTVEVKEPEPIAPEPVKETRAPKKTFKPKPAPKKAPVKKKVEVRKKKPVVNKTEQARKKAKSVGLFASQNSLSDIRNSNTASSLKNNQSLSNSVAEPSAIEEPETNFENVGSQGIETVAIATASATKLADREKTRVKHKLASKKAAKSKPSSSSRTGNRSDIATTFDRNKRILNNIYNRALRKDPSLQGKFVISLTISPEGKVTAIKLISSELNNTELENKLLSRIKMYKFQAINAGPTTQNFSIDFFPG